MVVAANERDDSTLWIVKRAQEEGAHNLPATSVRRGDVIRLEHLVTRRNLHSHIGKTPPIEVSQQEVTAFGRDGVGDENDEWLVEPETGDVWALDAPVRLVHRLSTKLLHSHLRNHQLYTAGFQEVTAFGGRDENDLWLCDERDQPQQAVPLRAASTRGERALWWLNILGSLASITGWTLLSTRDWLSSISGVRILSLTLAAITTLSALLFISSGTVAVYRWLTFNPRTKLWHLGILGVTIVVYAILLLVAFRLAPWMASHWFGPLLAWAFGLPK